MKLTNRYDVHYYYGVARAFEDDKLTIHNDPVKIGQRAAEDIRTLCDRILELEERLEVSENGE